MRGVATEAEFLPVELEFRDGRRVTVRAVRPQDKEDVQAFLKRLSEQSRYSRFMSTLRELSPKMLERAVNPEQGRELQLVAICGEGAGRTIVGGARYSAAAGSKDCEFALTVDDAWQGFGLARRLLEALIGAARAAGFERMEGHILASNARMLGLAGRLGFERVESPEEPTVRLVRRDLSRPG
ncbi:MAG TPA: GNAT family N-acetyltransferase [Burkholderiales bacterium]|nr:GNAT family N-acetyltransferase [Burkholderiales bacterium]